MDAIRNFSIIAHIDHGKSTLADRMLELTGTVEQRKMKEQYLDTLELERERGITIKLQTARMNWAFKDQRYVLNLIDTPGHVDFSYEVSRALAACESAILLVDATQGIQAQTISNALKASDLGLTLIPAINKIDLPIAQTEKVTEEMVDTFGFRADEIHKVSGKTGKGVPELLNAIIQSTPHPKGKPENPLSALVFDSFYDPHKGVIALVRIFDGKLDNSIEDIHLVGTKTTTTAMEWGYLNPAPNPSNQLITGEVGYIATGLKSIADVRVGDTITGAKNKASALPGYKPPTPMVFASFFPVDPQDWNKFRVAFEKLTLNDAAVQFAAIHHPALGAGYRCGFLGLLHMDIVKERLEKEYDLSVLVASPSVPYEILLTNNTTVRIDDASDLPEPEKVELIKEPYVKLEIITPKEYMGKLMELVKDKRGDIVATDFLSHKASNTLSNLVIKVEMPLAELITDTFDRIKAISHGYASLDYELMEFRANSIVKLDILVNREVITPLSTLVHKDKARAVGTKIVQILRHTVPRHQFSVPVQAAIGSKVIARETIPAYRKDMTAGMYGGDVTRKKKKLEKQKKGKKKLRKYGSVELPPEAFVAAVASQPPKT